LYLKTIDLIRRVRTAVQSAKLATAVPARLAASAEFDEAVLAALGERRTSLASALDCMRMHASSLSDGAALILRALRGGGRILIAGNGGSAAVAQHFATELVGRFKRERDAYSALALTADTAILTAIANDYGYEEVFARQVAAYGHFGDVLVAFSTSGESENLIRASCRASEQGIAVLAITGARPNRLAASANLAICVPVDDTPLAQELHMVVLHVLCDLVETSLATST
jgi:D-sedoheptulose 7-phosphate isomerase